MSLLFLTSPNWKLNTSKMFFSNWEIKYPKNLIPLRGVYILHFVQYILATDISKRQVFVIHLLLDGKNALELPWVTFKTKSIVSSFPTGNDLPFSLFSVSYKVNSLYIECAISKNWLYLEQSLQIPGHYAFISTKTIRIFTGAISRLRQSLATESSLKLTEKVFCFTLTAVFVLKIFKSVLIFWSRGKTPSLERYGSFQNEWRHYLENKQLQHTYCSISLEVKTIWLWNLVS